MSRKETIILGIDPGTVITGYGLVACSGQTFRAIDYGCIRPKPALPLPDRYLIIFDSVCSLIEMHQPNEVSVELQFMQKNFSSAEKISMARCAVLIAARKLGCSVFEYTSTQAKKSVVGRGGASKEQVQGMIQTLLSLSELPKPHDASDALAMAICHGLKRETLELGIR